MKGWPDYTRVTGLVENYDEYAQNYPVGIGDGVARLGSIKTHDMRGRVWFIDGFEAAVLKWETANAGVGGSQALSTAQARNGNQSVELVTSTGAGRTSALQRHFQQPRKETVGLEISFATVPNFGELLIYLHIADGADQSIVAIQILEATQTINYMDIAGNWIDTGFQWCLTMYPEMFHTIKIVQNYQTNEYLRVIYDHQELDLTGIPTRLFAWLVPPYTWVRIMAEGDNINNVPVYIDDAIITIMEPT